MQTIKQQVSSVQLPLSLQLPLRVKMDRELEPYFCQAIEHNYEKALTFILTNMEDPSAVVNKEYTVKGKSFVPMLVACEKGYFGIATILFQYGGTESVEAQNKHKCNCLHTACKAGKFQIVKFLCGNAIKQTSEATINIINGKSNGWTPLMYAINAKQEDIVRYLMKIPEVTLDSHTKKGQNVVHIAVQYSFECLMALQSSHRVSSMLYLANDKKEWNVLHCACATDNIEILKWLLELRKDGDNVWAPGEKGYSNELPSLLEDKINEKSKNGYTPLLVACEYQHKYIVEYLLSLPSVDPGASTATDGKEGITGLHIAAIHDSPDIAELLIRHKCPINAIDKEQGDTALHIARRKSSFDVYEMLKSKDSGLQEIENKDGQKAADIEPEEVIPPEIKKRGPEAVRIFHKALREGKQMIPHCKLMVLGEARVGKTSLIRHMTALDFDPELEPTHGIENQCIATMIDSKNVNINDWRTMSAEEKADRDQEHYVKAIAEEVKKEDPGLLAVKKAKVHPNEDIDEDHITEYDLVRRITEFFDEQCKLVQKSPAFPIALDSEKVRGKIAAGSHHLLLKDSQTDPEQKRPKVDQRIGSHISQTSHPSQTSYPPQNPKSNTKPILPVTSTQMSVRPTQVAPQVHKPSTTPTNPQLNTGTQLTSRSGIGRRKAHNIYRKLPSAAQETEAPTFVISLEVYDFAGQALYRPMHHCFMSRRAIYIVVFNLQDLYETEVKQKTFSDLQYWLNSIHAHVHNPGYKYEKYIFIVGTHRHLSNGKCVTDDELQKFSDEFLMYLSKCNCQVIDDIHFLSRTNLSITGVENSVDQKSSGAEHLKKEIEIFSKDLPFLAESYPISWMNFRDILLKKKKAGSLLLQLVEVKEIAKDCAIEEQAVHTALQLFHDTGVIIYPAILKAIFLEDNEKEQISSVILMEPRWLICIMTKVMEVQMSNPAVRNTDIEELRRTGMTTGEVLFNLWEDDHGGNDEKFEMICLLMRAHGLMQVIKPSVATDHIHQLSSNSNVCIRKLQFVIPCMLRQGEEHIPSGYTFYFDFKGFLPEELFHCLICLVIKKCGEVPDCGRTTWTINTCTWKFFKGFDWYIQLLREEHKLKVVAKQREEVKPGDHTDPMECILLLHKEYICPICEQSGLPGLRYVAGPLFDKCTNDPLHSVGVLAAVYYPSNGCEDIERVARCHDCKKEYNIRQVLLQTCEKTKEEISKTVDDFNTVSADVLGEDDLVDVMEEVMDTAPKWKTLGLALRLKRSELDTISLKNNDDPTKCLSDMLLAWLQQHYDKKKFGPPSWRLLCQCICKKVGGDNPALAQKIAKQHIA